jgi:hypothetical protein
VAEAGLRVPEDLAVVPVGTLPDDLGGRILPRIELPVAEMSLAVVELAVEAIAAATGSRTENHPAPGPPPHRLIAPQMAPGLSIAPPKTHP